VSTGAGQVVGRREAVEDFSGPGSSTRLAGIASSGSRSRQLGLQGRRDPFFPVSNGEALACGIPARVWSCSSTPRP
jgi:hypothetical protein